MVDLNAIRQHMDVIDSEGQVVGRVDSVDGARIKLTRRDSPDGQHHYVDNGDVARVDDHVHLSRSAAALGLGAIGAGALGAGAAAASHDHQHGTAATHDDRRTNWLPWVLGGAALLALLVGLSQCEDRDEAALGTDPAPAATVAAAPGAAGTYATGTMAYDVDRYLAGSEAAPRTFAFQRLNFDSGKATIRGEDESDLDDIARVLIAYPQARAAVVGYTDAAGTTGSNAQLGAERARAVIAALGARGVAATRLEARTGGEMNPEASNSDSTGMAANRRIELIVLNR